MAGRTLAYDHLAMHDRELSRLAELERLDLTSSPDDDALDRITRLVTLVLDVPMAAVSIVERDRQWFRSQLGLGLRETSRRDSFCSHVVALGDPLGVSDASLDERFRDNLLVTGEPRVRFYMGVPLKTAAGTMIGALCAIDNRPREVSGREAAILTELAAMAADRINLHIAASIDGLTGTMRRTAFMNEAGRDFARASRQQQPLGCLMIDVDHFKAVNDAYGHATGDRVLAAVGTLCRAAVRAGDYIGRMGGEEFCVMLPGASLEETEIVGVRLRNLVGGLGGGDSDLPPATVSIGVAAHQPSDANIASLMARADAALFEAKRAGRDRLWIHR